MALIDGTAKDLQMWSKYAYAMRERILFVPEYGSGNTHHAIVLTCSYAEEGDSWTGECVELGTATFADTFEEMRLELHEAVELQLVEIAHLLSPQDYFEYLVEHEVAIVPWDAPGAAGLTNTTEGMVERIGA
ncbi:MAG: hypothetical protein F4X64_11125 [Chloroflexi bacterium]|nr:hypothetical protein [Chloroflexota bacterium]